MDHKTYKKVEYELALAAKANRERIDELIGHGEFFKIADHDGPKHELWLEWNNELWNRLNWLTHQEFYLGLLRGKHEAFEFDEGDIKWTLYDYVYSK